MNTLLLNKKIIVLAGVVLLATPLVLFAQTPAIDDQLVAPTNSDTQNLEPSRNFNDAQNPTPTTQTPTTNNTGATNNTGVTRDTSQPITNTNDLINTNPYRSDAANSGQIYDTTIPEITEAYNDLNRRAEEVNRTIETEVQTGIDNQIRDLIRVNPEASAIQLQGSIQTQTNDLYRSVDTALFRGSPSDSSRLDNLETDINTSLNEIETILESGSGGDIDFTRQRQTITDALISLRREIEDKKVIIDERGGELIYQDTDGDGLSDYDETFIYGTDPENAFTVPGELSDSDKILGGFNPLSETNERIAYENPKEVSTAFVSDLYRVTEIKLIKEPTEEEDAGVVLRGRALPNSYVTLYIFSTPIVVTVRTDESGDWQYTVDEELENGDHEVFVATVNNSGKIIARSDAIPFVKTAEAATIGLVGNNSATDGPPLQPNIFRDNILLLVLAVIVAGVIITLMIVGRNTKVNEVVKDLQEEVNE